MTDPEPTREPWLSLKLDADIHVGADLRAFSEFLSEIAGATRLIADERLGLPKRRGRLTQEERALASIRLIGVSAGSITVDFARPTESTEVQLALASLVDADAVADDFVLGLSEVASGGGETLSHDRWIAMAGVLRSAGKIAPRMHLEHRPEGRPFRAMVVNLEAPPQHFPRAAELRSTERLVYGHVQMADVEDGRRRLRAKLPDGSDATIPVSDDLAPDLPEILDELAELQVREVFQGDAIIERSVVGFRILDEEEFGPVHPPRSVEQLLREQGLLLQPLPDYTEILDGLFPNEEDIESFAAYLGNRRLIA